MKPQRNTAPGRNNKPSGGRQPSTTSKKKPNRMPSPAETSRAKSGGSRMLVTVENLLWSEDGWKPTGLIAQECGITVGSARRRLRRLEDEGAVQHQKADEGTIKWRATNDEAHKPSSDDVPAVTPDSGCSERPRLPRNTHIHIKGYDTRYGNHITGYDAVVHADNGNSIAVWHVRRQQYRTASPHLVTVRRGQPDLDENIATLARAAGRRLPKE